MKDKRRKKVYPKTVAKIENQEEEEKRPLFPPICHMLFTFCFTGIFCIALTYLLHYLGII